ncbi:MAG: class I SAM-dependent methyltransferase [bacterium]
MGIETDPEQNEVRALERVTIWRRERVLEIGCGDGRLTLRLARLGAFVHAIDPDAKLIRTARTKLPRRFAKRIRYHVGQAEHLNYANDSFDLAVFAWAL